jgi:hypothetical protein
MLFRCVCICITLRVVIAVVVCLCIVVDLGVILCIGFARQLSFPLLPFRRQTHEIWFERSRAYV